MLLRILVDNSFAVALIPFLAIAAAIFLFYYGMKNNQIIMKLLSFAFLMMILGYTVNFHVIVRSNANPPLNENEPNTIQKFVDYVGRVQYGESKYWPEDLMDVMNRKLCIMINLVSGILLITKSN
jgi:hypothetical protein